MINGRRRSLGPDKILDSEGEKHSYRGFIHDLLIDQDLGIEWDDDKATITLCNGTILTANFSYNEPKIWFDLAGWKFRVLSSGELSVNAVQMINIQMQAMESTIYHYEG